MGCGEFGGSDEHVALGADIDPLCEGAVCRFSCGSGADAVLGRQSAATPAAHLAPVSRRGVMDRITYPQLLSSMQLTLATSAVGFFRPFVRPRSRRVGGRSGCTGVSARVGIIG